MPRNVSHRENSIATEACVAVISYHCQLGFALKLLTAETALQGVIIRAMLTLAGMLTHSLLRSCIYLKKNINFIPLYKLLHDNIIVCKN